MTTRTSSLLTALLLLVALTLPARAQSPAGTWDLSLDAGGSTHTMALILTEQGGVYSGTVGAASGPTSPLQNVKVSSDTVNFDFETPDYGKMSIRGVVKGDSFTGSMAMSMGEFPLTGTRKAAAKASLSSKSLVGELLANEQARAILDKHVPGLSSHSQINDAAGLTLEELATYAGDVLSPAVIKAINEDLSKL